MKTIIAAVAAIMLSIVAAAQHTTISAVSKAPELKTDYYEITEAGGWVLYLPMEFGKSVFTIQQQEAINRIKDATVARVDLVYSDYPAKQDFTALNKKRLESLQKVLPSLFTDGSIEFRKIRQTIGKTKATAEGLQHGFFIYFRPRPAKHETAKEIRKLKEALRESPAGLMTDSIYADEPDTLRMWCGMQMILADTVYVWAEGVKIPEGFTRTIKKFAIKDAVKMNIYVDRGSFPGVDSLYQIIYNNPEECPLGEFAMYELTDSTVSTVLKRNKWGRAMVIADVTGSMYPYTVQLLQWLAITLTDKQPRHFVFFNDGDMKSDGEKVLGKTGGIYHTYGNSYDEVEKTIITAMTNGFGGDAPENNIEALLEAQKKCSNCDSIVMIVDNWAPVKDISLLKGFGKPVKVVVCGVMGTIHKDYLQLARDTKGSIHLMEEDVYNLSEIKEGGTIRIGGKMYKLIKGEFAPTGSFSL
jgi:hypothetical protein